MRVVGNTAVIHSFRPRMEAVERVEPGEVLKIMMNDCFLGQITSEDQSLDDIDSSRMNPATGPVFVEGAQPGDLLKVRILNLSVASKGIAMVAAGGGILAAKAAKSVTRLLPIRDGACHVGSVAIPIRPMIGVIGVAPSDEGGELLTTIPWKHGGNMDTTDICEGSTVYLPVRQEGALLAMGDCHAVMGDGELCLTGAEVAGEAVIQVDVIKGRALDWPMVETPQATMVVASGETLYEAAAEAAAQAVTLLSRGLGISWEDAYMVASLAVDLKISQVVDPKKTVRAAIPQSLAPTGTLISDSRSGTIPRWTISRAFNGSPPPGKNGRP